MIPDIGVIIGVYTFIRLYELLVPAAGTDPVTSGQRKLLHVLVVVGMLVIAFLTADVVMQGVDFSSDPELSGVTTR